MGKFLRVCLLAFTVLAITNCSTDDDLGDVLAGESVVPESFKVDIPSSLSGGLSLKQTNESIVGGELIYAHLRNFIGIAEGAAEIMESFLQFSQTYITGTEMEIMFEGSDGNDKKLSVIKDVVYNGTSWPLHVSLMDVNLQENAFQLFWDADATKGIGIMTPFILDSVSYNDLEGTNFEVTYAANDFGYEEWMEVNIVNWAVAPAYALFRMDNLKMFVGKNSDELFLYGNSSHPDAYLMDSTYVGYNWAFVASASVSDNIAVAELGLPSIDLDTTKRSVILEDFSVKNVLSREILARYGYEATDEMLEDAAAPGYFNASGFVQAGEAPSDAYSTFENNIQNLSPYNPKSIKDLMITYYK